MRSQRFVISFWITASLIVLAGAANAANYEVSVKNRFFCCTSPPIFLVGGPQQGYHEVLATASVTGSGAPPLKLGMGHAAHSYSMLTLTYPLTTLKRTFSVSNGTGTLQKNGGNLAGFSFCPKAVGPGPGACTKASKATPAGFNGRIKVTPGKNNFGGTLQVLAGPGGIGGSKHTVYRSLHGGMYMDNHGGPGLDTHGNEIIKGRFDLAPIGAATPGYFATAPVSRFGFNPGMGYLWENGAGKFTTGMVTLQITMQLDAIPLAVRTVMLTGYDNRTPKGLGNIQLVSGVLVNRYTAPNSLTLPYGWQMRIQVIPEPAPGLGLSVAALTLACVAWVRGRRKRER